MSRVSATRCTGRWHRLWCAIGGVLIALIGALLIYGAFQPVARTPILLAAGASKLAFVGLVLAFGGRYLGQQVGIAVLIDGLTVVLFALYLSTRLRAQHAT